MAALILKIYFGIFFNDYDRGNFKFIYWGAYYIWQLYLGEINNLPGYMNVVISLCLVSIIGVRLYDGKILQKIVFSLLITTIWMLAEVLVGYVFILCDIYDKIPQCVGSLLSQVITVILIIGLKVFFKNENIRNLSNKHNIMLLLIPIGSMYVVYNIFMISSYAGNKRYILQSLTSSVSLLAMNIIIFKLQLNLSKEKELQKYNTVYAQQLELCTQHMREKEAIWEEFRNTKHDMKQHYIILTSMLESNDYKGIEEYLGKIINMELPYKLGVSRTNNIVVDAMINAKYSMALNKGIKVDLDIHIPMELPFKNADICILMGNILDNAIEASMQLSGEKRYVKLFMKYEVNVLILTVINAFSGELIRNREGRIMTNKDNPSNHGIGLESVKKVADKYQGSVVIETKSELFIIKVILCDTWRKLQETS